MPTVAFVLRRIALAIPTWLGVVIVAFLLVRMIPGDPAIAILGSKATPEQRAALLAQLGFDKPVPIQFLNWIGGLFHGDLGKSAINGTSVWTIISTSAAPSAELVLLAFVIALLVGVPLGIWSSTRQGRLAGGIVTTVSLIGLSVPGFVLGSLFVVIGAATGISMVGYVPFAQNPIQNLSTMIWPALALGAGVSTIILRYTRTAMIGVLRNDYLVTAKAMGVHGGTIIWRNGLRNAVPPIISATGAQLAYLMGGAVIVETVFAIPGIGMQTMYAVNLRDYPVVQGVVIVVATLVILLNVVIDIIIRALDPRIVHG